MRRNQKKQNKTRQPSEFNCLIYFFFFFGRRCHSIENIKNPSATSVTKKIRATSAPHFQIFFLPVCHSRIGCKSPIRTSTSLTSLVIVNHSSRKGVLQHHFTGTYSTARSTIADPKYYTTGAPIPLACIPEVESAIGMTSSVQGPQCTSVAARSVAAGIRPSSDVSAAVLALLQQQHARTVMKPIFFPGPNTTSTTISFNPYIEGYSISSPPSPASSTSSGGTKRSRKLCTHDGCTSKADQRDLCVKHGGRGKCKFSGCSTNAVGRGFCTKHGGNGVCKVDECKSNVHSRGLCKKHGGAPKGKCGYPGGCSTVAVARGRCARHGGKGTCKISGCTTNVQARGLCTRHGGNGTCYTPGCSKFVQARRLCIDHGGKKVQRCVRAGCSKEAPTRRGLCDSHESGSGSEVCSTGGCGQQVVAWSFCRTHVKRYLCTSEGCTTNAVARGLCVKHGAKGVCLQVGCTTNAHTKGACYKHRRRNTTADGQKSPSPANTPRTALDAVVAVAAPAVPASPEPSFPRQPPPPPATAPPPAL